MKFVRVLRLPLQKTELISFKVNKYDRGKEKKKKFHRQNENFLPPFDGEFVSIRSKGRD